MNEQFPCLPVSVLFHNGYWDGPLSGVCEYNDEKLYFYNVEEITFKFPETDLETLKWMEDNNEEKIDYHRLRIFNVYRMPKDIMDALIFNNELWETMKKEKILSGDLYNSQRKPLPESWKKNDTFLPEHWQYLIGYTTEDVWDRTKYKR